MGLQIDTMKDRERGVRFLWAVLHDRSGFGSSAPIGKPGIVRKTSVHFYKFLRRCAAEERVLWTLRQLSRSVSWFIITAVAMNL